MNTQEKRKASCRSQKEVWKYFEQKPFKSPDHFSAKCKYCQFNWTRGNPNELEEHLANNCKKVSQYVSSFYMNLVSLRDFGIEDNFIPLSKNNKKRKYQNQNQNQQDITDWFESETIL